MQIYCIQHDLIILTVEFPNTVTKACLLKFKKASSKVPQLLYKKCKIRVVLLVIYTELHFFQCEGFKRLERWTPAKLTDLIATINVNEPKFLKGNKI